MEINTVSAGGGTIARLDRFGALQVGPESAGAVPGPACYGRGGELPTITDCNLALGLLSEYNFLGGQMRLDRQKALSAIDSVIARPLGLDPLDAAAGIVRIINVKMEEAIKAISTIRGHDLRDFMLLAFGGAGPVHAGEIARSLGMAGIIVPLYPGVFSAIGLLMSDVRHDYVQSKLMPFSSATPAALDEILTRMERQAVANLEEEGFAADRIRLSRAIDLRYAGQGYELTIACAGPNSAADLAQLRAAFDAEHKLQFGHAAPEELVEIVSYRVQSTGLVPPVETKRFEPGGGSLGDALRERRQVRFNGRLLDCPIYQRERLDVGLNFQGPAIVEQFDCTAVVNPGQVATVDAFKNLIVNETS
jgi:N-methylhydantoinase A